MRFYTNVQLIGNQFLVRGVDNGKRFETRDEFFPTLYVKTKKDSKRVIRNRELEIFFKEQTRLTYRGFVIKFGEEAFKREKELVYKRLYYYKFVKPKQQNDYIQSELAFKTKQ